MPSGPRKRPLADGWSCRSATVPAPASLLRWLQTSGHRAAVAVPHPCWNDPDWLRPLLLTTARQCLGELVYGLVVDQADDRELTLRLVPRNAGGEVVAAATLALEIYRSGEDLSIMLEHLGAPHWPLLWQGVHPVWLDQEQGKACERPPDGKHAPSARQLEALARRLRTVLLRG